MWNFYETFVFWIGAKQSFETWLPPPLVLYLFITFWILCQEFVKFLDILLFPIIFFFVNSFIISHKTEVVKPALNRLCFQCCSHLLVKRREQGIKYYFWNRWTKWLEKPLNRFIKVIAGQLPSIFFYSNFLIALWQLSKQIELIF